jgi:hypothetical protein
MLILTASSYEVHKKASNRLVYQLVSPCPWDLYNNLEAWKPNQSKGSVVKAKKKEVYGSAGQPYPGQFTRKSAIRNEKINLPSICMSVNCFSSGLPTNTLYLKKKQEAKVPYQMWQLERKVPICASGSEVRFTD